MANLVRKIRRALLRDEPTYYDMWENPGERYFARLYLNRMNQILREQVPQVPLKILDAGCQTGRLAIPLAQAGHRVTGVDTSGLALHRCRRHAQEAGAAVHLIRADLTRWLPRQPNDSYDAVICNEVLYLRPNHRELLEGLIRVLRPGGLCFISHRPTGYYLAEAFQRKDFKSVQLLLTAREGELNGSYYNWQEREQLLERYRELKVEVLSVTPIGFFSWWAVNPEPLDPEAEELLFKADLAAQTWCPGTGRYLLVCGRKTLKESDPKI